MAACIKCLRFLAPVLVAPLLAGCGGPSPSVQSDINTTPNGEILRQYGLEANLTADKSAYLVGESVHLELWVTNTTATVHQMDLHQLFDDPERLSYSFQLFEYVSGLPLIWSHDSSEKLTRRLSPGEKVRLLEATTSALPEAGRYEAGIELYNLYVDGRLLKSNPGYPSFTVDVFRPFEVQAAAPANSSALASGIQPQSYRAAK